MSKCKEDDQHGGCEVARHEHQICNNSIDEDDHDLIHAARERFAHAHREGSNAAGFVIIQFVNMLAYVDACNAQAIRNTSQHNIPVPYARKHKVHASDHNRSPDEEDGELAQSPILEGIGICEKHNRAERKQTNYDRVEASIKKRVDSRESGKHAADKEPPELLRLGEESLHKRMDSILRAEVVASIQTSAVVCIIVEQVVRSMREEQAKRNDQERNPRKIAVAR